MRSVYILNYAMSVSSGHEYAWADVKFALSLLPSHGPVQVYTNYEVISER